MEENKLNIVQNKDSTQLRKPSTKDKLHTSITSNPVKNNKEKLRKKKYTKRSLKTK